MSEALSQTHTREFLATPTRSEARSFISTRVIVPAPLSDELYKAVVSAAAHRANSMQALRAAVRRFTITLKSDGAKPEAVLIALKDIINARIFPIEVSPTGESTPGKLREKISSWSIQDYFGNQQS